jgi:hypothetical protein
MLRLFSHAISIEALISERKKCGASVSLHGKRNEAVLDRDCNGCMCVK